MLARSTREYTATSAPNCLRQSRERRISSWPIGAMLRRRYKLARDAAGPRPLRWHDLRHTFGSSLVAGGIDLVSVKDAMGTPSFPRPAATFTRARRGSAQWPSQLPLTVSRLRRSPICLLLTERSCRFDEPHSVNPGPRWAADQLTAEWWQHIVLHHPELEL